MKIDVYSICYNEEIIIPYFIRHYKQFARNIIIYNNSSTDSSVELLKNNDVDIRTLDTGGVFSENALMYVRNNCWKGSDADWVIVCDMDEFIYQPNILEYLNNTEYTHMFARGYEMMSETMPSTSGQIYDEIKTGYPTDEFYSYNIYPNWKSNYSKGCIFKPSDIIDINFGPGSHYCNPTGNFKTNVKIMSNDAGPVRFPTIENDIKLLHYKYLSREYVISKSQRCYQWSEDEINKQYDAWLPFCKKIID